jgi:hypothetical protein
MTALGRKPPLVRLRNPGTERRLTANSGHSPGTKIPALGERSEGGFEIQDRATKARYVDLHDYERFPLLRKAAPRRIVLRTGQGLFMPADWWHTTCSLTDSVSYSIGIINSTNVVGCIGEHLAGLPRLYRKLIRSR